jgi:hypothetical protein
MKSRPLETIKEEANTIAVKDEDTKSFHLPEVQDSQKQKA